MKHTVKRTTAAILAALILAGTAAAAATFAAPTIAHAEDAGTVTEIASGFCGISGDNVRWKLTTNSEDSTKYTLTISGTGAMADYDSGSTPWYSNRYKITNVVIEDGVTSIGGQAFYGCTGLTSITIPDSVTSIGGFAFGGTAWLNNQKNLAQNGLVIVNDKFLIDGTGAPDGEGKVTIPDGITQICGGAFYKCKGFKSITIPDSVTSIGDWAFWGCSALATIEIPNDITSIGNRAFYETSWIETQKTNALNNPDPTKGFVIINNKFLIDGTDAPDEEGKVTIPDDITQICGGAFWECYNLKEIAIPNSVTSIGDEVFLNCSSLTSVTIPDSVTSIGNYAFESCTSLETVTMKGATPPAVGRNVFNSCSFLNQIIVPKGYGDTYKKADGWSSYEGKIEEGSYGYCGATGQETSVKWNFDSATGTLTISGKGKMADYGNLNNIPWKDYKNDINKIVIEEGVESIGAQAFSGCSELATVNFAENSQLETIGEEAFYSCKKLKAITIPASVKTIGNDTFYNCIALTTVTFAENSQLETIGQRAFSSCEALESIHIPAGVTSIQSYTFSGCTALATVTLSPKGEKIENGAFSFCRGLKELVIPRSVTEIGAQAFQKSGLMRVTIPAAVEKIGRAAFSDCNNLDEVIMEDTQPPTIEAVVFGSDAGGLNETESKFVRENTKGITVPYGSLEKYKSAENWSDYQNYMKEAPAPVSPAPSTDPVTVQKPTTIDENGNTITGSITTYPDGSVVDTTIVTKPNGDTTTTVVEKDPQGNTTKTTETKVETAADGTKTETETVTEAGKAPVITKTVTKKDGSQTIEKITSAENSRGNTVTTTETTVKDSKGNVVKKTTKKEIKNIGNGTDAVIDVDNNTAIINKIGAAKPKGMQATINNKVLSQLKEANNGKNLLLTMIVKDKDGNKRYSVEVNTADLTPKNELYIYKKDSKTGELLLVNNKAYITDSKGQLKLIIRSKGNFVLKNAEDAAKINEKILSTVQAKKNKVTLAKGKTEPFAFHEDLDMRNVKNISYETSDPRIATVNETGKIKGKKAGTTTITATVTLKNGETKILTMKVTVK